MKKIHLLIVDDHQMLIDGIKALLTDQSQFHIAAEATRGSEALSLLEKHPIDIVVTDINMPEMSGVELVKEIKAKNADIKILALSMFGEKQTIKDMIDAGVSGYILKNTGKKELVDALSKIASGGIFFSDDVTTEMMRAMTEPLAAEPLITQVNLTQREREILKLITKEYSNVRIADELFISERTVETHRKNIFRKTNTKSIVGLIKYAYENKLID
jgi:two-component system nitrate/nitrite response regulator NarL